MTLRRLARLHARPIPRLCLGLLIAMLWAASGRGDEPSSAATVSPAPTATASPAPSPVEIRGSVEPDEVTIGQRFRYTVEVVAPAGVEVLLAQPTERLGDFDIVDFGDAPPAERGGKTVVTRWFALVGYETGHFLVPSPPVRYRLPGEPLTEAAADETVVVVASLLARAPNASDIRDVKPPIEPPIDRRPYDLVAGAVAALALAALLIHRLRRRARRTPAGPPPRPAHEVAYEELARLRSRGLPQQGAFKEYYSTLTAIVRTYLEQRFRLRAPEMTTEEFLMATARGGAALQSGHRALLGDFLGESDLVKFARHHPTLADAERAYGAAERFVAETAVAGAPPAAATTAAASRVPGASAAAPRTGQKDGAHAPR